MLFAWVDRMLSREETIACPTCRAELELPAEARGRTIVCPRCEGVIEARPDRPPEEPASPGDSTPGLRTLKVGGETPAPTAWAGGASRTRRVLGEFRQQAGLTGEGRRSSRVYIARQAQPRMVPLWLAALLIVLASGASSLVTVVVVGSRSGPARSPEGVASPTETPPPPEPPAPRQTIYAGTVDPGAPTVLDGPGKGCRILTRDRQRIWLLLSDDEVTAVGRALEEPRARVCLRGRGTLWSASDERVRDLVPAGVEAAWILEDGPDEVEFIGHAEFLRTGFEPGGG